VSRPSEGCSEGQLGGMPAFIYTLFFINIMDKDQIAIYKCPLLQTCISYTSIDITMLLHLERNIIMESVNR
jgi:hypothetical protein